MRRSLRVLTAIACAAGITEAAVLLLRPRDIPSPPAVDPRGYFSAHELSKAAAYQDGQFWLMIAESGAALALLVAAVKFSPRVVNFARRRPVIAAAGIAVSIGIATTIVGLPFEAVAFKRAKDIGLATQSWGSWALDLVKSQALTTVFLIVGGMLFAVALKRLGRRWWIAGAAVVILYAVAITYAGPVVLDPLFNRFTKIEGPRREQILALASRAGINAGEVYEVDASRRTTGVNAYVTGLGKTKRVVLYDNLLKFPEPDVRAVVAHEFGHVHFHDVPRGILFVVIITPFGMLAAAMLAEAIAPRRVRGTVAVLPAVVLSVTVLSPLLVALSNQLSRTVEARADYFSLKLTKDPQPFIDFERRIVLENYADPAPPAWRNWLFGTHPRAVERIALAEEFRKRGH